MSGTTAGGWPYVTPDDHPKEYPAASQQLAEKIDARLVALPAAVATGTVSTAGVGVTFPAGRFTAPPIVTATGESNDSTIVTIAGVTAAGFTVRAFDAAGVAKVSSIHWIAVQYS